MSETETLDQRMARLKNGRWNAINSRQTTALVTINKWGAKRHKTVFRAQVSKWDERLTRFDFEGCGHNHLSKKAADTCAASYARALNKEDGL